MIKPIYFAIYNFFFLQETSTKPIKQYIQTPGFRKNTYLNSPALIGNPIVKHIFIFGPSKKHIYIYIYIKIYSCYHLFSCGSTVKSSMFRFNNHPYPPNPWLMTPFVFEKSAFSVMKNPPWMPVDFALFLVKSQLVTCAGQIINVISSYGI